MPLQAVVFWCLQYHADDSIFRTHCQLFHHSEHHSNLQDIREYELDYEAAKKTAAAVAIEAEKEEERRIKLLEKNPLGDLAVEEEDDFNFGKQF